MTTCAEPQAKVRPILFSGPMVRAILEGRKTQTRRVLKKQPPEGMNLSVLNGHGLWLCPYGQPGDRLWVKETHGFWCHSIESVGVEYAAGGEDKIVDFPSKIGMPSLEVQCRKNIGGGRRKRPSIFMPRWASRLTLEITGVRVERLQEISEEDALAEGIDDAYLVLNHLSGDRRLAYRYLWEDINGPGSWEKNPWVWVMEFRKL